MSEKGVCVFQVINSITFAGRPEKEDLELSIAEKEESLLIQREEHRKQAEEMTSRIENKVKIAEEQMFRLTEQRKAREWKRAKEERALNKELNTAKDLLKQYKEKIEAINSAVTKLSTDLKTMKSDRNSNEQEQVAKLSSQAQQYAHQIEDLKEKNVILRKELEKNESALNAGFDEHKKLSERYDVLKSKFSRIQKFVGEIWF